MKPFKKAHSAVSVAGYARACLLFWGPQQVFPEGPPSVGFAIESGVGMGIIYILSILIR